MTVPFRIGPTADCDHKPILTLLHIDFCPFSGDVHRFGFLWNHCGFIGVVHNPSVTLIDPHAERLKLVLLEFGGVHADRKRSSCIVVRLRGAHITTDIIRMERGCNLLLIARL